MALEQHSCPKCKSEPVMKPIDTLNLIPALAPDYSMNPKAGIYVKAYVCPHCNLIEFYHTER